MYPKLEEFTKEELLEQISLGKIDYNFFVDYTIKRDKVYNQLIDEVNKLQQIINKAIKYIKGTHIYGMEVGKTLLIKYLKDLLEILEGKEF